MQVLKFFPPPYTGLIYRQEDIPLEAPQDLEKLTEKERPAALVVRSSSLPFLKEFRDLVIDRGVKHPAKSLSQLLLQHQKIPLIDGRHRAAGQLKRSIKTLLKNAAALGERNIYVIGAGDEVFRELWQEPQSPEQPGIPPITPGTTGSFTSRLLHDLEGRVEVPAKLRQTFLGESVEARLVRALIMHAAQVNDPVLIMGDTGTGKEVVARAIYEQSTRQEQNFVTVNCAAIPGDLLENELFGHVGGAFTGAKEEKAGLWESAGEGVLFLDEIGDLKAEHQAKVLRALEYGDIRRLGASRAIQVKARVLAATNRDLNALISAGRFREDLYYRLRGFLIRTPALREHPHDIPLLAQHFWQKLTQDKSKGLPPEILTELTTYRWPGNARELKMVLNRLFALFGTNNLTVERLQWVFYYEGQDHGQVGGPVAERELILHRVECFRHLRRADEVIRATKITLRPIVEGSKLDRESMAAVLPGLDLRLNELDVLCYRPLLFHSEMTFNLVHRLKGKLTYLQGLLQQQDGQEARRYWQDETAEEFRLVLSTIFQEVDTLLKESKS
jgi:transcriptional regulator with AAA-type ATPase domain